MKEFEKYKKIWEKRELLERKKLERERIKALETAEKISETLARRYNVTRVILFGSVLDPDSFHSRSDIDIAVEGLKKTRYFEALGELMMKYDRNIDLKPVEELTGLMLKKISLGRILYEKRKNT